MFNGHTNCVSIAGDLFLREEAAHVGGLQEGQHKNIRVSYRNGDDPTVIDGRNVDAPFGHQTTAKGQTLGTVVVAAAEKNLQIPLCQRKKKAVQQLHGFGGGDALVVYITGDQHRLGKFRVDRIQDLLQNVFLIFDHGNVIDTFAQMQIG